MPFINASLLPRFSMGSRNNQVSNLRFAQPEEEIIKKPEEFGGSKDDENSEVSFKDIIKKCPPMSKMRKFMKKEAKRINEMEEDLF